MVKLFKLFFGAEGTRPVLVLVSLLLSSLCEAIGISALLPAISIISNGPGSDSAVGKGFERFLQAMGLPPTLETILILICAAFILKAIISFLTLTYAGISAAQVAVRLRQRLIDALFHANWRFYSSQASGKFATAISGEATRAGDAYLLAAQFCAMAIQSLIYVIVTLLVDWKLALLGIAVGGVMAWALRFLVLMSKRAGRKQTDATKDLTVKTVELLANIKPLKTMQRYESFQSAIRQAMRRLKRALTRREIARQTLSQISDVVTMLALVAVIYVSFIYFHVSFASLLVSGLLFMQVVGNVTRLQKLQQQFVQAESAHDRVTQLISLTEANREPAFGSLAPDAGADFRFEHVSFAYDGEPVLHDVSLTIPAREITVLKGLSGSGKTTLIDLLVGLHRPQTGRVLLGDTPLNALNIATLRRRIGYVSQELSLLHAPLRENICLGDESLTDANVAEAVRLAGLEEFIASLPHGLATSAGEMGARLSGGQRQRIALARALVTRPDILILDEVTSALDPTTEAEIVSNIRNLAHAFTIIVITHRDAWVEVADRLYEVRSGHVTELSSTEV
ncbi:ABC transporter ATP-binding protein [Aestuariivirga sp.]|uniref:ABC transporter ATP-binding protein n=1 Tax=Aestuariivirga sp. TaxID=2650926 RepID=UPI003BAD876B